MFGSRYWLGSAAIAFGLLAGASVAAQSVPGTYEGAAGGAALQTMIVRGPRPL